MDQTAVPESWFPAWSKGSLLKKRKKNKQTKICIGTEGIFDKQQTHKHHKKADLEISYFENLPRHNSIFRTFFLHNCPEERHSLPCKEKRFPYLFIGLSLGFSRKVTKVQLFNVISSIWSLLDRWSSQNQISSLPKLNRSASNPGTSVISAMWHLPSPYRSFSFAFPFCRWFLSEQIAHLTKTRRDWES